MTILPSEYQKRKQIKKISHTSQLLAVLLAGLLAVPIKPEAWKPANQEMALPNRKRAWIIVVHFYEIICRWWHPKSPNSDSFMKLFEFSSRLSNIFSVEWASVNVTCLKISFQSLSSSVKLETKCSYSSRWSARDKCRDNSTEIQNDVQKDKIVQW